MTIGVCKVSSRSRPVMVLCLWVVAAPSAGWGEEGDHRVASQSRGHQDTADDTVLRGAIRATLHLDRFRLQDLRLTTESDGELRTVLALDNRVLTMVLRPSVVRAARFQVLVEDGTGNIHDVHPSPPATYEGTLVEDPGSVVAASLQGGKLSAVIRLSGEEIWAVQPASHFIPSARKSRHLVYRSVDAVGEQRVCGVADQRRTIMLQAESQAPNARAAEGITVVVAEIAFDADVEFFQAHGGSMAATVSDIESIQNTANVIYERDINISHRITTILIRTGEPDPYSATDPNLLLDEFIADWIANQGTVSRDVAHLMTGKELNGSVVGIANVQTLCARSSAFGLSQSTFSASMPMRVALTAHELGHSWSALHCDADPNCAIMCSTIGGCSGNITSFSAGSATAIMNFANTLLVFGNCLEIPAPQLGLIPNSTCVKPGDTVTVTLRMSNLGFFEASGFQAFLSFDPTRLSFVGGTYTASPFGLPLVNPINAVGGDIDLAAGISQLAGQTPTSSDADLATLNFTALVEDCAGTSVVTRVNTPPTGITDMNGIAALNLTTVDTPNIVIDGTIPAVTCPLDASIACDASTDPALNPALGTATAVDACDGSPIIEFSDGVTTGVCPLDSTITRTWTAADACANVASCVQTIQVVDTTPPEIICPPDVTVNADAGDCSALVNTGSATVTDLCDSSPVITDTRSDFLLLTDPFPSGITTVTRRATDLCGNFAECQQQVIIKPVNELLLDVELSPMVSTPLTRCLTLELFQCPSMVPVVVEQEVTFTDGLSMGISVQVPCGMYNCITARDRLHTLRRTDTDDFRISGTRYVSDFTNRSMAPGDDDSLIGGDLNDDHFVDIFDFGIFTGQWAGTFGAGDTTCATEPTHADISGNGTVFTDDFTFIQINLLSAGDMACCGAPGGVEQEAPTMSISSDELRRRGLYDLMSGDLNGDGWLDTTDFVMFMRGVRPSPSGRGKTTERSQHSRIGRP